jgi:type 1 glutamine amidotransferase
VRVFATTLGHHNEEVRSETWQAIVAAGTKWAIGKE